MFDSSYLMGSSTFVGMIDFCRPCPRSFSYKVRFSDRRWPSAVYLPGGTVNKFECSHGTSVASHRADTRRETRNFYEPRNGQRPGRPPSDALWPRGDKAFTTWHEVPKCLMGWPPPFHLPKIDPGQVMIRGHFRIKMLRCAHPPPPHTSIPKDKGPDWTKVHLGSGAAPWRYAAVAEIPICSQFLRKDVCVFDLNKEWPAQLRFEADLVE